MPLCKHCAIVQASSEMRRSTVSGIWLCKDKEACKRRRKALGEGRDK